MKSLLIALLVFGTTSAFASSESIGLIIKDVQILEHEAEMKKDGFELKSIEDFTAGEGFVAPGAKFFVITYKKTTSVPNGESASTEKKKETRSFRATLQTLYAPASVTRLEEVAQ